MLKNMCKLKKSSDPNKVYDYETMLQFLTSEASEGEFGFKSDFFF